MSIARNNTFSPVRSCKCQSIKGLSEQNPCIAAAAPPPLPPYSLLGNKSWRSYSFTHSPLPLVEESDCLSSHNGPGKYSTFQPISIILHPAKQVQKYIIPIPLFSNIAPEGEKGFGDRLNVQFRRCEGKLSSCVRTVGRRKRTPCFFLSEGLSPTL